MEKNMKIKALVLCLAILFLSALGLSAQDKSKAAAKDDRMAKTNIEPLKAGAIAPDFTLTDQNGKTFQLSKAKSAVVLVFYRGYW